MTIFHLDTDVNQTSARLHTGKCTPRTDYKCSSGICLGNIRLGDICPYQEYLSCCYRPNVDQTFTIFSRCQPSRTNFFYYHLLSSEYALESTVPNYHSWGKKLLFKKKRNSSQIISGKIKGKDVPNTVMTGCQSPFAFFC